MMYVWAVLLVVTNALWLLCVLLALPGNWMMVAATALLAWGYWQAGMFSVWTLAAIVALAVVGEVVEFVASAAWVRRAGGSRWGCLGALVGSLVGAVYGTWLIPLPVAGTLIGACLGSCLGAWLGELASGRSAARAARLGLAGGAGRLIGTLGKFAIGMVIWLVVAVAAFWP